MTFIAKKKVLWVNPSTMRRYAKRKCLGLSHHRHIFVAFVFCIQLQSVTLKHGGGWDELLQSMSMWGQAAQQTGRFNALMTLMKSAWWIIPRIVSRL